MNRRSLAGVCAVVLVLLVGIWWGTQRPNELHDEATREVAAAPEETRSDAALEAGAATPQERARSVEAAPEPEPLAPSAAPAAESKPANELPPKDALGELVVHVHDKQSARAIRDATLRLYMLRRGDEPGSAYFWPEEIPAEAVTDASGTARLRYPAWVAAAGLTSKVGYLLKHAEYPSIEAEVEITGLHTEHTVELEFGCYLVVSGWIGDPTHALYDVTVRMDDASQIRPADWIAGRDGRLATNRAKAEPHALSLAWTSPQGERYESRVVDFALTSGEQREFALELLPTLTLRGRFDDAVPRPIGNGAVMVAVAFGGSRAATSLRAYQTDITADGRFEIGGLPHGHAEVIAICDGWASTPVRIAATEELDYERDGNQFFELPRESELVIAMQPTAAVELELVDEAGAPIAGAEFAMWPNVHWDACGYSTFFLERQWTTQTDALGRARLDNLPVTGMPANEGWSVDKPGWVPVGEARDDAAAGQIEIVPGRTAALRVVMKPKAD